MVITIGVVFWILMLAWLIFWLIWTRPATSIAAGQTQTRWVMYRVYVPWVLEWILLFLLGWSVFGLPLGAHPYR